METRKGEYREGFYAGVKDLENEPFEQVLLNLCFISNKSDWDFEWVQGYYEAVVEYVQFLKELDEPGLIEAWFTNVKTVQEESQTNIHEGEL